MPKKYYQRKDYTWLETRWLAKKVELTRRGLMEGLLTELRTVITSSSNYQEDTHGEFLK